jgi:hypothetical protein
MKILTNDDYSIRQLSLIRHSFSSVLKKDLIELFQICVTCMQQTKDRGWKRKKSSHSFFDLKKYIYIILVSTSCSSSVIFQFSRSKIYRTSGWGVPGHLLGNSGSAAACIRK